MTKIVTAREGLGEPEPGGGYERGIVVDGTDLWFGMVSHELLFYDGEQFFTRSVGWDDGIVDPLRLDDRGDLWVAATREVWSSDHALLRLEEETVSHYQGYVGPGFDVQNGGPLWFPHRGFSPFVVRVGTDEVRMLGPADGMPPTIRALSTDGEGRVWVASHKGGATRIDGEDITHFTTADGLTFDGMWTLFRDRDGDMWFGTHAGLSHFKDERFHSYTVDEGLGGTAILAIGQDHRGHMWISTAGGGISRFDGEVFQTLTSDDGVPQEVYSIATDAKGDVWLNGAYEVGRFRTPPPSPPPVWIDAVVADERHPDVTELELTAPAGLTTFEFHGTSLKTRPGGMVYRYRLRGHDDWQTTRERRVEYTDLPIGDYTFEVVAIDRDLVRSDAPAVVAVTVVHPIGHYALGVALFLAIIAALWQTARVVRRDHRLTDQNQQLTLERAAERVRAEVQAMESANDLLRVVGVMHRELIALGFPEESLSQIHHYDPDVADDSWEAYNAFANPRLRRFSWSSTELIEIDARIAAGRWPLAGGKDSISRMLSDVARSIGPDEASLPGALRETFGLFNIDRFDEFVAGNPLFTHYTGIPFSDGGLGLRANRYLTDDEIETLGAFSDALTLGFTRFQDFRKLEADAERAHLEGAVARVRAEAQAMQSADDIRRVVGVIYRELMDLGFDPEGAPMVTYLDPELTDQHYAYFAGYNPRAFGTTWTSDLVWEIDDEIMAGGWTYHQTQQWKARFDADGLWRQEVDVDRMHELMLDMSSQFGVEGDLFHFVVGNPAHRTEVRFTHGSIGWLGPHPLSDEHINIFRAFCDALELGFTRFRDFQQLETASANKSQFLRRMSHDLRSPMNAIIGYSRLLGRRLADRMDEREARNLSNIETSSGNLLSLINDILDLSRIEAGRIEINEQPVDVKKLADECADALESIVKENVILRRDLDDVGVINSDPDRLRQIVMNLLGNATKFTEAGSITLSLKRVSDGNPSVDSSSAGSTGRDSAASSDNHIEISVADTGIGIPADDLPHIFDEFRQVERQGGEGAEGTGLGLAIAKKTVDLLGGDINATSEVGVGTTFTVRLAAS